MPDIDYFLYRRYEMENTVRTKFIEKGGKPINLAPVYFTLGENKNMETWFADAGCIKIPIDEFDLNQVSFTYGDMFPVFNPNLNTGEEWWGQVYRYEEILEIINKYGYPEDPQYHMYKRQFPKEKPIRDYLKYVEAHVWSNDVFEKYKNIQRGEFIK